MLMPSERKQAIDILVQTTVNTNYNTGSTLHEVLRNGHKGFASYSDLELMRALTTLGKKTQAHEVQSFLAMIAVDKFILE